MKWYLTVMSNNVKCAGEARYAPGCWIGHSILNRLTLVCFTERAEDIVRIFSARLATQKEREDYEENASR